eukprot:scaffold41674_cov17-Tisochrysis_lutea.AAC.1
MPGERISSIESRYSLIVSCGLRRRGAHWVAAPSEWCAGRRGGAHLLRSLVGDVLLDGHLGGVDLGRVEHRLLEQRLHRGAVALALLLERGRVGAGALLAQLGELGAQRCHLRLESRHVLLLPQSSHARRLGLPLHPLGELLLFRQSAGADLGVAVGFIESVVRAAATRRAAGRATATPLVRAETLAHAKIVREKRRIGGREGRHGRRERDALERVDGGRLPSRLCHRVLARCPEEARE